LATPISDSYSAATGSTVRGGRGGVVVMPGAPPAGVSPLAAFYGDSLTAHATWCPHYWTLGLIGAPLDVLRNGGFNGQSIGGLGSQLDNSWNALPAGLAGAPALGWIFLRIGTNNARGAVGSTGVPIDASYRDRYDIVIAKCLAAAAHVVIFPVPPIGGALVGKNTSVQGYNDYLQSKVAADPRLHWIDDTADLTVPGGAVDPAYFGPDELHFSGAGAIRCALTAKPQLEALFANQGYTSPLITSGADVYPMQPQWVTNPTNAATGGTRSAGWTGTGSLPAGVNVSSNGGGTSGTAEIIAPDLGDPNPVPWLRIVPATTQAGSAVAIRYTGAGRNYASNDPSDLEQTMQVRLTGFNGNAISQLRAWMQGGGQKTTLDQVLLLNKAASVNGTVTLRQRYQRTSASSSITGAVTPLNYIYLDGAGTGPTGSIDIRCFGVRG
jgi:lysophospholipase L1-like esterase